MTTVVVFFIVNTYLSRRYNDEASFRIKSNVIGIGYSWNTLACVCTT